MYELNEETRQIEFSHNPFSMPQGGLAALDSQDPLDIIAYQYDIVCNGVELSSGAIRNHRSDIMYKAFAIAGYAPPKSRPVRRHAQRLQTGRRRMAARLPASTASSCCWRIPQTSRSGRVPDEPAGARPADAAPAEVPPERLRELHLRVVPPSEKAPR